MRTRFLDCWWCGSAPSQDTFCSTDCRAAYEDCPTWEEPGGRRDLEAWVAYFKRRTNAKERRARRYHYATNPKIRKNHLARTGLERGFNRAMGG